MPSKHTHAVPAAAFLALLLISRAGVARDPTGPVFLAPFDYSAADIDQGSQLVIDETVVSTSTELLTAAGLAITRGEAGAKGKPGKAAGAGCDFACRLKQAREGKAAHLVTGRVGKSEGSFVGFVRLYRTSDGRQIQSIELEAATVKELRAAFRKQAPALFADLLPVQTPLLAATPPPSPPPPAPPPTPVIVELPPAMATAAEPATPSARPADPMPLPPALDLPPPVSAPPDGPPPDRAREFRVRDAGGIRLMKCDQQLIDTYAARDRMAEQARRSSADNATDSLEREISSDQTSADRLADCAKLYGSLYRYAPAILATERAQMSALTSAIVIDPGVCAEIGRRIVENRSLALTYKAETEADAATVAAQQERLAKIIDGLEGLKHYCR